MKQRTLIIAEAGVNHNGSLKNAKRLIDIAAKSEANIVKFQTFISSDLVVPYAKKAKYQLKNTKKKENQLEMLLKYELSFKDIKILFNYAKRKKIEFLSTAFDLKSFDLLKKLKLKRYKIASGEINNYPLLVKIGKENKRTILSTGMSDINDIKIAVNTLLKNGLHKKKLSILQCTTEYPVPFNSVNLKAMHHIKKVFPGIDVGFSDHTLGIEASVAAVAMGAKIIEKHITLNKKMKGPDHKSSLEPKELVNLIRSVRNVENALGKPIKTLQSVEKKNKLVARKSLVAKKKIEKNDKFSENNLGTKRPGSGISPMKWNILIGKKSKQDYKINQLISKKEISN